MGEGVERLIVFLDEDTALGICLRWSKFVAESTVQTFAVILQGDSYTTKPIYLAVLQAEQCNIIPCVRRDHRASPGTNGRSAACYRLCVNLKVVYFNGNQYISVCFI